MVEGSGGCGDWRFGVGKDGRWQRGFRGFWGVALLLRMACSRDKNELCNGHTAFLFVLLFINIRTRFSITLRV